MGVVSESIAHAARSFGADVRVNADVRRILVKDGRAVGVELSTGERIEAKVIASGADPKRTFLKFLERDRKSTRLNSSHQIISYAVFCLKKKKKKDVKNTLAH